MSEQSCDIMRCDSLARRLLPRMRAEMVYRLVNERGISQSEVSKRLGISRAAISQVHEPETWTHRCRPLRGSR